MSTPIHGFSDSGRAERLAATWSFYWPDDSDSDCDDDHDSHDPEENCSDVDPVPPEVITLFCSVCMTQRTIRLSSFKANAVIACACGHELCSVLADTCQVQFDNAAMQYGSNASEMLYMEDYVVTVPSKIDNAAMGFGSNASAMLYTKGNAVMTPSKIDNAAMGPDPSSFVVLTLS